MATRKRSGPSGATAANPSGQKAKASRSGTKKNPAKASAAGPTAETAGPKSGGQTRSRRRTGPPPAVETPAAPVSPVVTASPVPDAPAVNTGPEPPAPAVPVPDASEAMAPVAAADEVAQAPITLDVPVAAAPAAGAGTVAAASPAASAPPPPGKREQRITFKPSEGVVEKDKEKIKVEGVMQLSEVIANLERMVTEMKSGIVTLTAGEECLELRPSVLVNVDIKASRKKDKEKFSLEISWKKHKELDRFAEGSD